MILVIGNKRLSSWSLRPWLVLSHFDIPFEEKLIPLDQPETNKEILKHSPSGKVPVLIDGTISVWDSLAIAEYLNEKFPNLQLWAKNPEARAWSRSASSEMHSGFSDLRKYLSHDLQKNLSNFDFSVAKNDIDRIRELWTEGLQKFGGPFLAGQTFSIVDAMFAPVANRFFSYGVVPTLDSKLKGYVELIRSLPAHQKWIQSGLTEKFSAPLHT